MSKSTDEKPTFEQLFNEGSMDDGLDIVSSTRERPTSVFMCKTDWEFELYNDTCKVYHTIEQLKKERTCGEECGIVEVEITLKRVVTP